MSVNQFCWLLNDAKYGKNDKKWFPRWIRNYASSVDSQDGTLGNPRIGHQFLPVAAAKRNSSLATVTGGAGGRSLSQFGAQNRAAAVVRNETNA